LGEAAAYSDSRIEADTLDETTFVGVDNLLPNKAGKGVASYQPNTARVTAYEVGDVLLGNIRPYLKKIWLATDAGGCSGDVLAIRISPTHAGRLIPEFLYHLLSADKFFAYNMQNAKGSKMPRGSKEAILRYRIPLPPIDIQQEIVRVLDQFRALQFELEAELEARRLQYSHYREALLSLDDSTKRVKIGDVADSVASGRNKSRNPQGDFPVYGSTGLIGYSDQLAYSGDVLLVARVGAYAGMVNAVGGDFDVSDNTLIVRTSEQWNVRYAFHQLTHMNLNQYAVGGGQPLVTGGLIKGLEIALPPLDEQKRIASILDTFDTLVNDISIGLPAELAARRKQHEHYSDRLLTLKELAA
jgi:type I restriction enzyme S subunit